ncbi:Mediator of RNA polymerase II transcription subunit 16 [Friedmanniomyces endolithicus]|nr:Mediator of RNA polymerase II transcription subunit 16 [Friedmanniomyces endolithicus]KAK0273939.1 Mediator of RNA polymerase II transcription subunit 16 [Friedmanniomyces endolithicus]KAK1000469.1 Mediator of RNA polymerase II transcription subunit 16 [Friedmanniomyces endolithicus]
MVDTAMDDAPDIAVDELMASELDPAGLMDPMDDLFGDTADGLAMPAPIPAAPLPASLGMHISNMQGVGCTSMLAWSNAGYMAAISRTSGAISFRTIIRHRQSGESILSEELKYLVPSPEDAHFAHIQFSGAGTELAAADSLGGVHVYTMTGVLGRLQAAPTRTSIKEGRRNELERVVGLHWLQLWPGEFRAPYITPASKVNGKWQTQMRVLDQHVPQVHHALENRSALLYVNATSKLILLYQNEQGIWQSYSVQLGDWQLTQDLLTHAAIGEEGDHLILTTHDYNRRFRVFKITIHWNSTQQSHSNGTTTTVSPTLEIGHLTLLDQVGPQQAQSTKLSILCVIPAIQQFAEQGSPTATTVVAVFTHAPSRLTDVQQEAFSVLAVWTLESITPTLHEYFATPKTTGQASAQPAVTVLRRQQDVLTDNVVLDVRAMYHNTMVALTNSGGAIEWYNRSTWTPIEAFGDTLVALSLPQSGFEYVPAEHIAHVAVNTDGSAMVITRADGSCGVKYVKPRYTWDPLEDGISDITGMIETAIVCLARQYAIVSSSNGATDETLAILPPNLSHALRALFIQQAFRNLCRTLDVSLLDPPRQQQTVLKEQTHLRMLSAQLALGTRLGSHERDFGGQFAYVYLNMRLISVTLAQTFSTRDGALFSRSPNLVPSLIPLVTWVTDLIVFIIDSLAVVKRDLNPGSSAKEALEHMVAETGNPALHILLCSFPRVLLRTQTSAIAIYLKWIQTAKARAQTLEHKQQMDAFCERVKNMPFAYNHFVEMLMEFDAAVRSAYTEAGCSAEARVDAELAMMIEGTVPDALEPAVDTLMGVLLPRFEGQADMGKVYFWHTEWLGIHGDRVPLEKSAVRYDALRKVRLTSDMKLRVCRRCGAEMEDLSQEALRMAPDWVKHGQRQCFCQGYWWPLG